MIKEVFFLFIVLMISISSVSGATDIMYSQEEYIALGWGESEAKDLTLKISSNNGELVLYDDNNISVKFIAINKQPYRIIINNGMSKDFEFSIYYQIQQGGSAGIYKKSITINNIDNQFIDSELLGFDYNIINEFRFSDVKVTDIKIPDKPIIPIEPEKPITPIDPKEPLTPIEPEKPNTNSTEINESNNTENSSNITNPGKPIIKPDITDNIKTIIIEKIKEIFDTNMSNINTISNTRIIEILYDESEIISVVKEELSNSVTQNIKNTIEEIRTLSFIETLVLILVSLVYGPSIIYFRSKHHK
jgi:hypothetical protein